MIAMKLTGWLEVPKRALTAEQLESFKEQLTVTPLFYKKGESKEPIEAFRETGKWFKVPIDWGLRHLPEEWAINDCTVDGGGRVLKPRRIPDPSHPSAPPAQADFMEDLYEAAATKYAAMGVADTGLGKTVCALWVAAKLQLRTLIIVPTEQLMDQWVAEAKLHLGLKDSEIGKVQQDTCEFRGKQVVVALIHSLVRRDYGDDFKKAFGLVVYDECHVLGATTFSRTMGMFPAKHKLALTATPKRADGCAELFFHAFGPGYAIAEDEALATEAWVIRYVGKFDKKMPKSRSLVLNRIAEDERRNEVIAGWLRWLYAKGRHTLVLSDRISQLETLMSMCHKLHAIPLHELGQYSRERTVGITTKLLPVGKPRVGYAYVVQTGNTGIRIKNGGKVRVVRNSDDGHVIVQDMSRHTTAVVEVPVKCLRREVVKPKRVKLTKAELEHAKTQCRLLFATYDMAGKGFSEKRLDALVVATPRAEGQQPAGRVRRKLPGKPKPIILAILDVGVKLLEYTTHKALDTYRRCNIEVKYYER